MKGLFSKIGTGFAVLGAILGFSLNNAGASVSPANFNSIDTKSITAEITEQTPLYLYQTNQSNETDNKLLAGHYSHSSHSSHYSHSSHHSHYSSRY